MENAGYSSNSFDMTFGYLAIASSGGSWGPSLLDLHQGLTCLRFNEPTECNLAMSQSPNSEKQTQ